MLEMRTPKGNKYEFRLIRPDKLLVKACPYRAAKGKEAVVIWPIVVPESLVPAIIGLFHGDNSPLSVCVARQPPQHQRYSVHPKAVAPMNRICIDIVGPFEKSTNGNTHILTIYDPFSHWPSAYPIKKQDAQTVIDCLKKHIADHSACRMP